MKFIKVGSDASQEERKEISGKVLKGELKPSHFAVDGDKFYHYYEVLKR